MPFPLSLYSPDLDPRTEVRLKPDPTYVSNATSSFVA